MHRFQPALLLAAALAISGTVSAAPKDPQINATVEKVPADVTLSRPSTSTAPALESSAAYRVTLQNKSTNELNRVAFSGSTTVDDAAGAPAGAITSAFIDSIVVTSVANPLCQSVLPDTTSVQCDIGQIPAGGSFSFVVIAKAPTFGSRINFSWKFVGDEGKGLGIGCCDQVGVQQTGLVDALADNTTVKTKVTSIVRDLGTGNFQTFFTGATAIATSTDPLTTTVKVPGGFNLPYTLAELEESTSNESCSTNSKYCLVTTLKMDGSFSYLEITLRRDASTIKGGAKVDDVPIYYTSDTSPTAALGVPINPCDAVTGLPVGAEQRCVYSRYEYPKVGSPAGFERDWEVVIRAFGNGRTAW